MATTAAVSTWRQVWTNPADSLTLAHQSRVDQYNLLWSYYVNSAFEDVSKWTAYRQQFGLYRHTRSIYNPVQRVVDFYANHVYPGVLSEDGSNLPDGVQLAIPLAEDTDPDLKSAIAQFWQWSNWQDGSSLMVTYGAALGNVLVKAVDELDREKVTADIIWPGKVADLILDATGNVKSYILEYEAQDVDTSGNLSQPYTYREEVDEDSFRFFKDEKPFDYDGQGAEYDNPYGFVPAVWAKHRNQGGDYGMPAVGGSIGKIDELNSLASHTNDQIHKVINGTMLFTTDGDVVPLLLGASGTDRRNRVSTADMTSAEYRDSRQSLPFLKASPGTDVKPLAGQLDLSDAMLYLDKLVTEIEHDFPELTFYKELRSMSQITGPAAARLTGDVGMKVQRAQANYDQSSIKLFQMATAISGWRLQTGAWRQKTRQQEKFRKFNLESYQKGDLDFSIMPRQLVPVNEAEAIEIDKARAEMVKVKSEFISENQVLRELNYSDEEIIVIQNEQRSVDVIPSVEQ